MARTAPVPNFAAIPGMNPGLFVLGGGGDGGGSGAGGGGAGKGKQGAGGQNGGNDATGGGKNAPDPQRYPDCGTASHPVDVVTGRAFTHPLVDFRLPGPVPLEWTRVCSSTSAHRDSGIGWGWSHSLGWEIELRRRRTLIWNDQGVAVEMPALEIGNEALGPFGWLLRRDERGFLLDIGDGLFRRFAEFREDERCYCLTAITDKNQNSIALTYEDGRIQQIKDSAGRLLIVRSTPEGRISSISVQSAASQGQWIELVRYSYDEEGCLTAATDADGYFARYEYDEDRRLATDIDRTGLAFHFHYDQRGRCVESYGDYPGREDPSLAKDLPATLHDGVTRAKGIHHCKFEYGDDGSSDVIDSTQVRRFFGNEHGLLDKAVEGPGVTTATYRADGHQMSRTDPEGGTTTMERDERGRLLKVTDPLGRTTSMERDDEGRILALIDPAGGVTRVSRDERGNMLTSVDPTSALTTFSYDARGLVTKIVGSRGGATLCEYDEHGNRTQVTAPDGGIYRFEYDALGRCVRETDPSGADIRYEHSPRGDLLSVRDPAGAVTRYSYDGEGRLIEQRDPNGRSTRIVWGGFHKVCARIDAAGQTVRLEYNREGELLRVIDERGQACSFEYDSSGRLVGEVTADGRALRYRNDLCGRLVRFTDGEDLHKTFEYDAAGQLVACELADGVVQTFEYDMCSRLVRAATGDIDIVFDRDAMGRVIRERQSLRGEVMEVASKRDPGGAPIERRTSLGHTEETTRSAAGDRIQTLLDGQWSLKMTRDAHGRETSRLLPDGGRIESDYDPAGRLIRRRALNRDADVSVAAGQPGWVGKDRGVTAETLFGYEPSGELIETVDLAFGKTERTYDPVGQLLSFVPEKARAEIFRYDASGNVYETDKDAPERAYGAGNLLEKRGSTTYRFTPGAKLAEKVRRDALGAEECTKYTWNSAGLLERIELPGGRTIDSTYDPFARRIEKRVTKGDVVESTTRFVWDGDKLVHEVTRRSEAPDIEEKTYIFEDGMFDPVAHRERRLDADGRGPSEWFYYGNDIVGRPERLFRGDGTVAATLLRSSWGQAETDPQGASTPLRFPGQYEDAETGLCYHRYRYYDPETGLFLSADPLGIVPGLNVFRYAPNPIRWRDPLGLAQSRRSAISQAQAHAQVPRDSRGGENIPLSELNHSSRGPNWANLARQGASLGRRCNQEQRPGDRRQYMDHPDGHPDAGQPGVPPHHALPHIHATNQDGNEIVIPYDP